MVDLSIVLSVYQRVSRTLDMELMLLISLMLCLGLKKSDQRCNLAVEVSANRIDSFKSHRAFAIGH